MKRTESGVKTIGEAEAGESLDVARGEGDREAEARQFEGPAAATGRDVARNSGKVPPIKASAGDRPSSRSWRWPVHALQGAVEQRSSGQPGSRGSRSRPACRHSRIGGPLDHEEGGPTTNAEVCGDGLLGGDGADVVVGLVQRHSEITLEDVEDRTLPKVFLRSTCSPISRGRWLTSNRIGRRSANRTRSIRTSLGALRDAEFLGDDDVGVDHFHGDDPGLGFEPPRQHVLDEAGQLDQLLVDPRLEDPAALAALPLDETLMDEGGERLADGRPAHAALGGEILFGREKVTGNQPPVRDRQRDLLANLVMERDRTCWRRRVEDKIVILSQ